MILGGRGVARVAAAALWHLIQMQICGAHPRSPESGRLGGEGKQFVPATDFTCEETINRKVK